MIINDRIKGVFFGQAIGDALGLATEFMSKEEALKHYPNGVQSYHDIIQDKHRSRWVSGNWTDDTDQWICILEGILENKSIEPLDIASRLYQWMMNGGMGIGISTYKVMSLPQYTQYPYKGAELIWKMKRKDLAPNGALMRNSIICLFKYKDLDLVLDNCKRVAMLTHYDPRCVDSCKIMAHLIHGELVGNPISLDGFEILLDTYDSRIKEYLLPIPIDIAQLKLDESSAIGYTLKALSAGVWAYYNATSIEDGLHSIIMEAGDADTNGCIGGSLLGAKFGYDSIPKKYIDGLNESSKLTSYFDQFIKVS